MTTTKENDDNYKKTTKYLAIISSVIYGLLLLPMAYLALAWIMIFDKPSMTIPIGLILIALMWCVPLSMLISVICIYNKYCDKQYRSVRFFCFLPLITFGIFFVLNAFLQTFFL